MSYTDNHFLSWYIPRIFSERTDVIDLHSSGVGGIDASAFPVEFPNGPWAATSELEAHLAEWLSLDPGNIVFTPGATGGNLVAMLSLVRPGKTVLVESPVYEPMLRQAERLGPVRRIPRTFEEGWKLSADRVGRLIDDDTDLVLITEPHNPSGVFSDREEVLALAAQAASHGATLLINEVYQGFSDRPSFHGAADNIVVVNSLSKLFGTYWARLGWLSATRELAGRLRQGHTNIGMPSAPGAAMGSAVMQRASELSDTARTLAHRPLSTVQAWVDNHADLVEWHAPQGPGFGCLHTAFPIDDVAIAQELLDEHGVLVVPGTFFEVPGAFRLTWLRAGDRLEEGLDALARVLHARRRAA